jgi:signal transduction histidine kinase/CheY-like chemotaxis protein
VPHDFPIRRPARPINALRGFDDMRLHFKQLHGTKTGYILLFGLFIAILTGGRLLWHESFKPVGQPSAEGGVLDLRGMDMEQIRTLTLDGEWEFFSGVFLMTGDAARETPVREAAARDARIVRVPGKWDDAMRPGKPTPYGYGSYRLRILLDPGDTRIYSLYVPSVRSSSKLYVNGALLHTSGRPAPDSGSHLPVNKPYTAAFTADDSGVVEIVFEAANYSDPRGGGLVRSLKFGLNEALQQSRYLSIAMQQFMLAALFILSAYLFVLHFIGRNRKLLHSSLLSLSVALLIFNSTEDKVLMQALSISYGWNFRILNLSVILLVYVMIRAWLDQPASLRCTRATAALRIACSAGVFLTFLLPVSSQIALRNGIIGLSALPVLLVMFSVVRTALRGILSNLLLAHAALALLNHFAWWTYYYAKGMKLVFYPFDLILAIMMLSTVWFSRYMALFREQQAFAAKLQETDRKRDEFLVNTSHELRNPLHGILNLSQVVLERERHALSERSARELGTVLSIGRQMSMMVDELLDFTRLKDGRIRLNLRPVSLHPIANGVLDMVRHMANEHAVRLTNRIPPGFPRLMADENRLTQILYNLLHNAVKFTSKGEIAFHAEVTDGMVRISVSDTGIGMDEQTARRVFLPYEQGSGDRGGIGLGLSISKRLVELHGGHIDVRSAPNQGSTISFTLPLADASAVDGSAVAPEPAPSGHAAPLIAASAQAEPAAGLREPIPDPPPSVRDRSQILAVDDDIVNLNILVSVLSPERYDIVTVTDPLEALELIDAREWDLVICDVMMPHMSGYELVRTIRKRYDIAELPVLLITAVSRPEDIANGFRAGANDHVAKPVEPLELQARVRVLSQLRRSARELVRMEAAWLQAQIQPHFFFNTLNSIAALQHTNPDQMIELIDHFSTFLREKYKFRHAVETVLLADEFQLVQSYLYIEQVRYGDLLRIHWEAGDPGELRIPPYTLQPLVENAIRHGIMKRCGGGNLWVRLACTDAGAELSVVDDGVGMPEEVIRQFTEQQPASAHGLGIGLRNVDYRLRRVFGAGLRIESAPGEGTKISFIID